MCVACVPVDRNHPPPKPNDTPTTNKTNSAPVMVAAGREAFSQLLLHRNAVQDHIPDAYFDALTRLLDFHVGVRGGGGGASAAGGGDSPAATAAAAT